MTARRFYCWIAPGRDRWAPIFVPYVNRFRYTAQRYGPLTNPQTPIRKAIRFP
jgi:hypothetical protein